MQNKEAGKNKKQKKNQTTGILDIPTQKSTLAVADLNGKGKNGKGKKKKNRS